MTRAVTVTSGESIYRLLRDNILSLKLTPGQELKIDELAVAFGVSRSPVRDALMHLSKDDLVDIFPQRGTRVSLIDLNRVRAERFMRKALEDHAIQAFMQSPRPQALMQMKALLKQQQTPDAFQRPIDFLALDDAFHETLFTAIDMGFCFDLIGERCVHYRRIRMLTFGDPNVLKGILQEHEALLSALETGNAALAAQVDRRHLSKLKVEQKQLLKAFPHYFN